MPDDVNIAGESTTEVDELPSPDSLPEIRLVAHSSLLYWWPVWLLSLVLGFYSLSFGEPIRIDDPAAENIVQSSTIGLVFTSVMLAVILFTNVKMRGLESVIALMAIALTALSLAYFELWDDLARLMPKLSVHMNAGFYLLFGVVLMVLWLLQFLVFDRLVYYRIRPGQMIEERVIGGGERSYDTQGILFEQKNDDFFRHRILGLGSGDLTLITHDARKATLRIPNVLNVERRVAQIQRLINVKPEDARGL